MKRLKVKEEEVQEGEIIDSSWDLKKLLIGFVVLIIVFIIGSYLLKFGAKQIENQVNDTKVLGAKSQDVPPLPTKKDIDQVITNAKNTLSEITSENLTSSSSAIQKLIDDLHELQGHRGAVGAFCKLICSDK